MRAYTSGKYALEVEGVSAGWIFSAEGGNRSAEVVVEKLSQEHHVRKHIAGLKYEDITLTCGIGMSKHFWHMMHSSFKDGVKRLSGAIHACDFDGNIHRTLEFHQGLVTEIGFPALDAAAKDAAKVVFKLAPEWTRTHKGSGKIKLPDHSVGKGEQKLWLPSNFRLRIDGLERACSRINKIEAMVIKQKVVDNPLGEMRLMSREPASLEMPNLVLTTAESHAQQFYNWERHFLIHGNCSDDDEKTGTLEYLTSDLKKTLFTINMAHMGLFKLTADKMDAGAESLRRVKCEMYVEEMTFHYEDGSTWA